jgi:hypothetical protein
MATYAEFRGYPGLRGLFSRLAGYHRSAEFRSTTERVKTILDADYKVRVANGVRSDGATVSDWSGVAARRKGRYRGKSGPPGAPSGTASRLVRKYRSTLAYAGSSVTYVGRVEGFPAAKHLIVRYGYGGVSDRALRQVRAIVGEDVLKLIGSGASR